MTNPTIPDISPAAAELLVEALDSLRYGVELGGTWSMVDALELTGEKFGYLETEEIGDGPDAVLVTVFRINDAGEAWLADMGRIDP